MLARRSYLSATRGAIHRSYCCTASRRHVACGGAWRRRSRNALPSCVPRCAAMATTVARRATGPTRSTRSARFVASVVHRSCGSQVGGAKDSGRPTVASHCHDRTAAKPTVRSAFAKAIRNLKPMRSVRLATCPTAPRSKRTDEQTAPPVLNQPARCTLTPAPRRAATVLGGVLGDTTIKDAEWIGAIT
jgi:hypothetical protein